MTTLVPSCSSEAQHRGKWQAASYLCLSDRPKTPSQHQATPPGTDGPKTIKLQPLETCAVKVEVVCVRLGVPCGWEVPRRKKSSLLEGSCSRQSRAQGNFVGYGQDATQVAVTLPQATSTASSEQDISDFMS